tara:strand:- start:870 stop:1076 length:207 start_codon:yes stop_codon:yes gene_type:complete
MDLKSEKAQALTKKQVFEELKEYIDEQVQVAQRKCMDEENFQLPAFSEFQAYQRGIQKALTKLYNLLP